MVTRYVGPGGADGNSGLTWALRKLTLNGVEDTPVVAGDIVWVGPGVYRELLTCDVSGGNTYSTGTVSVTNGSDQVTGNGTAWVANVAAGYYFHIRYYDNGADGVANATATFTAAGGNFHANLIGCPIQINTKGAYTVAAVAAANSLTLADPNALGWPAAGGGLTYSIMSGEGHYEIESVDDNTTITLVQPWQGKTHTGLNYLTFNAITYIADVTGENTDSVGGIVRITGSDNDQTTARTSCILSAQDYRAFRGFYMDTTSDNIIQIDDTHNVVEDCVLSHATIGLDIEGTTQICVTMRRCVVNFMQNYALWIRGSSAVDDTGHVFENCVLYGNMDYLAYIGRTGGQTYRNIFGSNTRNGLRVILNLTTGQTTYVVNSIFIANNLALYAATLGMIIEDYNTLFGNTTDRTNIGIGANSVAYSPVLQPSIFCAGMDQLSGFKFPGPVVGELSEWSQLQIAGADERNTDLFGIPRPATAAKNSWGPVQFHDAERETGTKQAGSVSIAFHDAGVHQIWVPVANESTTISVYVYREANYAGTNPRMIIKQPGQADDVTTDAAAASQWNQLSTTLTPAAIPPYVVVELQSLNTAAAGNYDTFFDTLVVS